MARGSDRVTSDGQARLPFATMMAGQVFVWVAALAAMLWIFTRPVSPDNHSLWSHESATLDVAAVVILPLLGYFAGLYVVAVHDRKIVDACELSVGQVEKLASGGSSREGYFLLIVWVMIEAYAFGYCYAVWKFAQSANFKLPPVRSSAGTTGPTVGTFVTTPPANTIGTLVPTPPVDTLVTTPPVNAVVAGITGLTVGTLAFFAVRYAAYVRTTRLLEGALIKLPRHRGIINYLRDAVFRGEQLYDPPGSVFVTLGITATFLGLATALVNLDLHSLLQRSDNPADPEAVTRALGSFVGCMGLALGVSMLGVMTAIAAQWLRGHGATLCTEELLARALEPYEEAVAAAEAEDARRAVEAGRR